MHDVLIAGGGPVGAALALALRGSGLDVALIDSPPKPDEALRPVALSHASRLILERLDAFDETQTAAIHSVHVSQAGGFGRTLIRREELDVPALGYVVNLQDLQRDLSARLGDEAHRGRVNQWQTEGDALTVQWQDEQTQSTRTRLLVIADGGGQAAGDDLALRNYNQNAIVATVRSAQAPEGRAWERFCSTGPLALLPFRDRYALVWTVTSAQARGLCALGENDFLRALQQAFGQRLGAFVEAGPRLSFPLQLRFRSDPVAGERTLIVGNAAQTLHPVAGQGLNLGLRDAFELAQLLRTTTREEIGGGAFLDAYRRARVKDRRATIGATDGLIHLFGLEESALSHLRGPALTALDLLPPLRRVFARRMVYGLRNLP